MFTNILTLLESSETNWRDILLVDLPSQTLLLEEIINAGDVGRDVVEIIIVNTKVGAASGCNIIGLGGMGNGIVVVQKNTFLYKTVEISIVISSIEILSEMV